MPSLLSHGTLVKIVSSERLPYICLILTQSFGYWGLLFNLDFYWNGEIFSVQTIWLGLYSLQENYVIFFYYQLLPKVFKVPIGTYYRYLQKCSAALSSRLLLKSLGTRDFSLTQISTGIEESTQYKLFGLVFIVFKKISCFFISFYPRFSWSPW